MQLQPHIPFYDDDFASSSDVDDDIHSYALHASTCVLCMCTSIWLDVEVL